MCGWAGRSWRCAQGLVLVLGVVLWCAPPVDAHRQRIAFASVEWNAQSRSLEIIHRVHAHDAIEALMAMSLIDAPSLSTLRSRAALALYFEENCRLKIVDGEPLDIETIGVELEGDYAIIYREAPLAEAPSEIAIDCRLFDEAFADFANHINVGRGEGIKTLILDADKPTGRASLTGR